MYGAAVTQQRLTNGVRVQVLSQHIEAADISDFQKMQMQANVTTFEDVLGGCERLLRTPIPLSYTRHTSRFLLLWLTALPFCMWTTMGWGTIPATVLIAMLLLGYAFVQL